MILDMVGVRERRGRHDPGRVVRDLAVMLADGGDCLSDLRAVRDQEPLFGPVASDSTAFRLIDRIADEPLGLLDALRGARAAARERAWKLGVRPERIVIDIDATLVNAHTEKEGAAVNYRSGFGFHPMLAYLDETHEALAGVLRGGGAPAHSAEAQIDVLDLALAQLPIDVVADLDTEIVMRIDSAGAAGALCARPLRTRTSRSWSGSICSPACANRSSNCPRRPGVPRLRQDGQERNGAQIAEITHIQAARSLPVAGRVAGDHPPRAPAPWRAGSKFTDHEGHRFQATLTDLTGDMVEIERLHRGRGDAENLIRSAKQTGLENLPFREFALNAVWLEFSLIAQDLIAWTQRLCLTGELSICEPKALRYRLLHTAGRLLSMPRRAVLRLPANWPWAGELAAAFARLRQLAGSFR